MKLNLLNYNCSTSIGFILGAAFAHSLLAINLCVAMAVFCLVLSFILGIEFSRENDHKFDKFVFFRAKEEARIPGSFKLDGSQFIYKPYTAEEISQLQRSKDDSIVTLT